MKLRRCVALFTSVALASVAFSPANAQESGSADGSASVDAAPRSIASVLTDDARRSLAVTGSDETLSVVVRLADQLDLSTILAKDTEGTTIVGALQGHASREQALLRVLAPLWELGPSVDDFTPFWIINGFSITATPAVIAMIAGLPDVVEIDIEHRYEVAGVAPAGPAAANIDAIGAPTLWSQGYTGEGVTVAILDTGVDLDGIPGVFASEVAGSYRGGTNSWFDPYNNTVDPYDLRGHGTAVASIITGRDLQGSTLGVAPDAQWIAAKIFDDSGSATTSAIHSALQWALDPDGDPTTNDGADVVNASWTAAAPGCDTEFAADIATLRAAGVIPVFAAGNLGPNPASSPSPSNLPGVLAVGAVRDDLSVLTMSSRGPTECGGSTRTYPHVVAPGESINAQNIQGQYFPQSGTSFAAPHVTGALALLMSATGSRDDVALEAAIVGSAGDLGEPGADDTFGAGMVDVVSALELMGGGAGVVTPTTGSVTGLVFDDADGNGLRAQAEVATGSVQVTVFTPGADATLGTGDDVIAAETVSGPDGTFAFAGLEAGPVRVVLSHTSLPGQSVLTTPAQIDLTVVADATAEVVFGWKAPDPGSISIEAFDDVNSDGVRDLQEGPVAGVAVRISAAGLDGLWGTSDDPSGQTVVTDANGVATASGIDVGPARIVVLPDSLPDYAFVSGISATELTVEPGQLAEVTVGVHVPANIAPVAYLSFKRAGHTHDGTLSYRDEDILAWDGERFEMLFDGSDVGLADRDVDAFHLVDANTILLSIDRPLELPDVGLVSDGDVIRFDATLLGPTTRGVFSMEMAGASLGIEGPEADIDAITVSPEGQLVVSIRGNLEIGAAGLIRDEDLFVVDTQNLDADGVPEVTLYFDGSKAELSDRSEDIDAAAIGADGIRISTLGDARATGFVGSDADLILCGEPDACAWVVATPASWFGLTSADIDGVSLPTGEIS